MIERMNISYRQNSTKQEKKVEEKYSVIENIERRPFQHSKRQSSACAAHDEDKLHLEHF